MKQTKLTKSGTIIRAVLLLSVKILRVLQSIFEKWQKNFSFLVYGFLSVVAANFFSSKLLKYVQVEQQV